MCNIICLIKRESDMYRFHIPNDDVNLLNEKKERDFLVNKEGELLGAVT